MIERSRKTWKRFNHTTTTTLKLPFQLLPSLLFASSTEDGRNSEPTRILGSPGADVVVQVPTGVSLNTRKGHLIGEINEHGDVVCVAKGGRGGGPDNGYQGKAFDQSRARDYISHGVGWSVTLCVFCNLEGFRGRKQ